MCNFYFIVWNYFSPNLSQLELVFALSKDQTFQVATGCISNLSNCVQSISQYNYWCGQLVLNCVFQNWGYQTRPAILIVLSDFKFFCECHVMNGSGSWDGLYANSSFFHFLFNVGNRRRKKVYGLWGINVSYEMRLL